MSEEADIDEKIEKAVEELEAPANEIQGETPDTAPVEPVSDEPKKPSEEGKPEPAETQGLDAPASWPSDDKEAFRSLPTWAQETIVRREHEREAAFTQRSMEIANRSRDVAEIERQSNEARARYASELESLGKMAQQLMPAKFQDIQTEADYIKLKQHDPARASEFEAFQMMLRNAQAQSSQLKQQQDKEHLDREWFSLQEKFPEFKDQAKADQIMQGVRKAAVEWYGYSPQEAQVIGDHRFVPILRDAIAFRQQQANLKTAEAKKAAPQPVRVIQPRAASGTTLSDDRKTALLNKARKTDNLRDRADLVASLLD